MMELPGLLLKEVKQKAGQDVLRRPFMIKGCLICNRLSDGTSGKESANAGDERDADSIPGSGRSHGEGQDNPLHYFCLENSIGREAWQAIVPGIAKELSMT